MGPFERQDLAATVRYGDNLGDLMICGVCGFRAPYYAGYPCWRYPTMVDHYADLTKALHQEASRTAGLWIYRAARLEPPEKSAALAFAAWVMAAAQLDPPPHRVRPIDMSPSSRTLEEIDCSSADVRFSLIELD